VPAAGSPWLADRLEGPLREVAVVAAGPHAIYLDDAADRETGQCLAVLDRHAVAVPLGLRTELGHLPRVRNAMVGGGHVRLGPLVLGITRLVGTTIPALPHLRDHAYVTRPWLDRGCHPRLDDAHHQLPAAALRRLHADNDPAGLIGLGPGFTPLGDDVVCGWLVTRHALGLDGPRSLPVHRTTSVSASFLRRAAVGEGVAQLNDLLVAVGTGVGRNQIRAQLDDLLRVGSSSGAGLAIGVALALAPPSPAAPS